VHRSGSRQSKLWHCSSEELAGFGSDDDLRSMWQIILRKLVSDTLAMPKQQGNSSIGKFLRMEQIQKLVQLYLLRCWSWQPILHPHPDNRHCGSMIDHMSPVLSNTVVIRYTAINAGIKKIIKEAWARQTSLRDGLVPGGDESAHCHQAY